MSGIIHILEGPAGSGKSHLRKVLAAEGIPTVQSSLPVRIPKRGLACELSLSNDLQKLSRALCILLRKELVVIDRCYLSQWVYRQCRLQSQTDEIFAPASPTLLLTSFSSLLYDLSMEIVLRSETAVQATFCVPQVHFWILLPTTEEIWLRRTQARAGDSSIEYPWPDALVRPFYKSFEGIQISDAIQVTLLEENEQVQEFIAAMQTAYSLAESFPVPVKVSASPED